MDKDLRSTEDLVRPSTFCKYLLYALQASEGRRKKRKRNTTPDAIGMGIKRDIMESVVREDPPPESFQQWLAAYCLRQGAGDGPFRAMAIDLYYEWQTALTSAEFQQWLLSGAPSEDAEPDSPSACQSQKNLVS
ncbi:hypothetical protein Tter_0607 [Thermobaculum terrenum ATCC BAA-798]|uniref:Uncharacterized protein n=2 Tax=Thermobaculum TaxID=262406 RepID=D1CF19_THET1|nr:hypothetical protein Tter_0607 [Thermobaculum terrenum ATCC BAA-798]